MFLLWLYPHQFFLMLVIHGRLRGLGRIVRSVYEESGAEDGKALGFGSSSPGLPWEGVVKFFLGKTK